MSSDDGLHGMSDERALTSLDSLYEARHGGNRDRWRVLGTMDERAWQPETCFRRLKEWEHCELVAEEQAGPRVLEVLADRADRHAGTPKHSRRVAASVGMALHLLGVSPRLSAATVFTARLHDIGKLAIDPRILSGKGQLAEAEWLTVRMHARLGADFLSSQPGMAAVHPLVRHHHERVDGSGYLGALAGEAIPFGSRLIAIADSLDAMVSNRLYRQALGLAQARQRLGRGAGSQWDIEMVDLFLGTPLAVRGAHDVEVKEQYR